MLSTFGKHRIEPEDAEFVVRRARRPYPGNAQNDKFYVAGRTASREYIQDVFIVDPPPVVYVIHARRLNEREKRVYRRRIR